jgi:NAD(P)-dependent dehydrogenase (short-subunit alcohol dehydrogenase family)
MKLQDVTKLYDFTGKTVVVTGGSGILGREMARALVGCNANVAILGRDERRGEQALQHIASNQGAQGRALFIAADVLDKQALLQAEAVIQREFGAIHALVNAAGGNQPRATTGVDLSFFDLPEDALRFVFDLNILGAILPSQIFGRTLAQQKQGAILNISSMSAMRPMTRVLAYSAAKAGLDNFTRWLSVYMAQEFSPSIRVNALAPGFFRTEQNRFLLTDRETGALTARGGSIIQHTPMGRFGDPSDLLGATIFLLSDASAFITGVVLPVDGGFSAFSGV